MNKKVLYLDSNDNLSRQCFKNNTNSNFTIQLPHNYNFKSNASASLKSIYIPKRIKNIKDYTVTLYFANGNEKYFKIEEDVEFEYPQDFISYLSKRFIGEGIICNIINEKVKIVKSIKSTVDKIKFSPNLTLMLGFSTDIITFPKNGKRTASEKLNFDLRHVSFFIVMIDIIEKTIYGEKTVGILKILPKTVNGGILSSYNFSDEEKKRLMITNFSQITIKILTDELELVKFSPENIATKLMIEIED